MVTQKLASSLEIEPHQQLGQWAPEHTETIFTWANLVTLIRTVVCVVCFALSAIRHSPELNFIGLGLYWSLDILDGYLARALHQETRIGAQMDILSDRLLVAFFYLNYLTMHLYAVVPIALFLIQFMWIDHYLSNQFLRWPILSPNYFDQVDKTIWQLNWSPVAKMINTGLVTSLLIVCNSIWLPTLASVSLIAVKLYSVIRSWRLTNPETRWYRE